LTVTFDQAIVPGVLDASNWWWWKNNVLNAPLNAVASGSTVVLTNPGSSLSPHVAEVHYDPPPFDVRNQENYLADAFVFPVT
jgi:hypothetical protein